MNNHSTKIEIGQIGDISHISGMLAIGGDVVAGNKTVIQNIIQQAIKKIVSQPYKFLSSYEITDKDIFFGRDTLTEQLAGKVSRHRVLLINGASGSGKSSLINAGLIPRLAENGYTYLSFRDYHDPLRQLQDYLIKTRLFPTAELQVDLLTQMVRAFQQQQLPVVFIFDQFERFFVNVPSGARTQFIEMIKNCMESLQPNEMNVIFSMREEFFGQFQREFEKMIRAFLNDCERINIDPLSQEEARQAIIRPLTLIEAKIGYDKTFVDEILLAGLEAGETGETGEQKGINPPHLQIVCNQLYQAAYQEYLQHHDLVVIDNKLYEQLGGAQIILQTYLDDCVKTVAGHSLDHIKILRSLLKQMIETVGTRKFVTAQHLTDALPEIPVPEVEGLLKSLQDARVIEIRPQEQVYSLSHEFMVEKVKDWFDEREMARKKAEETLEHGLAEWQNSSTLLNDKQVDKIRNFLKDKQFNELEQQLLLASERSNRKKWWAMRFLYASLVTFVLLSIGFGIFSYFKSVEAEQNAEDAKNQANIAKQQAQTAKLRQLGSQALLATQAPSFMNGYYDRALLLAGQAFKEQDNLETRGTLLRVMNAFNKEQPKIVAYLHGHKNQVTSIAMNSNDATLASGSEDNSIILWNIDFQQPLGQPLLRSGRLNSVALSPDGTTLAGNWSNKIILWDVKTQQPHGSPLIGAGIIAFSPDSAILANESILWNVKTHQQISSFEYDEDDRGYMAPIATTSIAFNFDGTVLAEGRSNGIIILWNVKTQKPLGHLFGHRAKSLINSITFSPDNMTLASGGSDKSVILWDVKTRQPISKPLFEHSSSVKSVAFSPDGVTLASGSEDGSIIWWNIETHRPIGSPSFGHNGPIESIAFSRDGTILASGSGEAIILWSSFESQQSILQQLFSRRGPIENIVFSPDNVTLAIVTDDFGDEDYGSIHLWNAETQQPIGSPLQGHGNWIRSIAFSPDGNILAGGSDDGSIILWDVKTQRILGLPLLGHNSPVWHVVFSLDGNTLVSGSNDNTIVLWDAKTQQMLGSPLFGHNLPIWNADFSPDGTTLISCSYRGESTSNKDDNLPSLLREHSSSFASNLAFSPDGNILASSSKDKIILWDTKARQSIGPPLDEHNDNVSSVAFSADGKTLVSGSRDGSIILWDIDPQSWYQKACRIAGRNLTQDEWQRYLPGEPYQKTCLQYPSGKSLALIAEGEELLAEKAEPQNIEIAISKFNRAFVLDPTLKEHPLYSFNPETKARKIAVPTIIGKGKSLAQEEKLDEAIATFQRAKELDNSLPFDPQQKANQLVASVLVNKGESLAKEEKLDEAIAAFKRAKELDASLTFDPQQEASQLVAPVLFNKGESLAKEEKLDEAIAAFKRAKEFDASLTFDPQQKANQLVALVFVSKGESLAQEEKIDEAIAAFKRAKELDANVKISADSWHTLCRRGSLAGQAAKVLESCETAVKLTNEQDVDIRDSRGLARTLTGDFKGAIADFQFFVQHTDSEEKKKQRQSWIKELKRGKNPMTEEVLQSLKGQ